MPIRCLVGLFAASLAWACDVGYNFGKYENSLATKFETTLTWWTVEPATKANVYLSTAIGTGCNSGYFGAQFHSDGKGNTWQTVLFSMWDNPLHVGLQNHSEWPFQGMPASGNCWRNALDASGKSTGVQCGQPWPHNPNASLNISLHLGVPYEFTMAMKEQNQSGALWEVSLFDPVGNATISVGKIFFVDAPFGLPRTCRSFGKVQNPPTQGLSSYSFLEYFTPPFDYTTVATWSKIRAYSPTGDIFKVPNIVQDCCGRTYAPGSYFDTSRRCLPPECDSLELQMICGPYVQPTQSAFAANPQCANKSLSALHNSMQDCWQYGSPPSLDTCFARGFATAQQSNAGSDAAIVV